MINANALVWGGIIFLFGVFVFWIANRFRLKTFKWIGMFIALGGGALAVLSVTTSF